MQKGILNVSKIREDFPILRRIVNGNNRLVYLDNAAYYSEAYGCNKCHY